MTELSRQLDLLAQRPAIDGDLLILIVMAVFWLVGGLAKILANKKGPSQSRPQSKSIPKPPVQRETWQQRLARKARELQEAAEAERRRTADQPRTTREPETRPAGTITVRKGPKGDSVMVYEKPPVPSPRQKAVLPQEPRQSVRMPRQEISPEPTRPLESFTSYQPPKSPRPEPLRAVVDLGLDDPDILRNAIVYSEILGKPLALRDTLEETARSESPE